MSQVDSTPRTTDEELVVRARRGDGSAVTRLCERYRSALVAFCYRYLCDTQDAEDAAQSTLARIAAEDRWPKGTFRPWLYCIARHHCLNLIRDAPGNRVGLGTFFRESKLLSPRTGPSTAVAKRELDERIRRSLAALPEDLAEILTLQYFEGMSRHEIAEVLGVSEIAVKGRLAKARREMAHRFTLDEQ